MPEQKHAVVYTNTPRIMYQSRCECGAIFLRESDYAAREALAVHLHRYAEKVSM